MIRADRDFYYCLGSLNLLTKSHREVDELVPEIYASFADQNQTYSVPDCLFLLGLTSTCPESGLLTYFT